MVIDRGAFLAGDYLRVLDQIVAETKQVCGDARLKVILETGELATYDNVRRASWLALLAGADFVKTSTGKIAPAATPAVTAVHAPGGPRLPAHLTGLQRAVKPAGGIRTTKDAIRYLVLVHEVAGPEWLDPHWFRFGASSVLNDLVMQRRTQAERALLRAVPTSASTDQPAGPSHRTTTRRTMTLDLSYAPAPESAALANLRPRYQMYVDGAFVDGQGPDLTTVDPSTSRGARHREHRLGRRRGPRRRRCPRGLHRPLVADGRCGARQVPVPHRADGRRALP